jgi:hypothetical protein
MRGGGIYFLNGTSACAQDEDKQNKTKMQHKNVKR